MAKLTKRTNTFQIPNDEGKIIKTKKEQICSIIKKKTKQKFLTESQKEYYEKLISNQITICSGPAGVGKSFIAMKCAIDLLSDPENSYEKIIIVRPAVEAEEKLGSLPGNVEEKLDPYIFPSYYLLNKIIGKETREKLKEIESIEYVQNSEQSNNSIWKKIQSSRGLKPMDVLYKEFSEHGFKDIDLTGQDLNNPEIQILIKYINDVRDGKIHFNDIPDEHREKLANLITQNN